MATDKNFKMSKSIKYMMALAPFANEEARNAFKRIMIDAEVSAAYAKIAKLKEKEKKLS
jgi:hypothetical protein